MPRQQKEDGGPEVRLRERKLDPSPARARPRSRRFDASPPGTRAFRARTYEPSPSRTQSDSKNEEIFDFNTSPLRVSFRFKKGKSSPVLRESKSVGRFEPSPSKEVKRSSAIYPGYNDPWVRDAGVRSSIRSRRLDPSPVLDPGLRSRRQDPSPVKDSSFRSAGSLRFSHVSPSPVKLRDRYKAPENLFGDYDFDSGSYDFDDHVLSSPRLRVRAPSHRQPLKEIPTPPTPAQSYRICPTSRDDDSDLDNLTKVREILLGDPIKGNTEKPAKLLPHMYLGNQTNAESLRLLRKLGVTHVLNCAGFKGPRKNPDANPYEGLGIEYLEFKADDRDAYDMSQHFDAAFSFLDRVKRSGGVCLVHCALGINRSGVTVVAYLMIHSKWGLLKALQFVKKKRGVVLTNHGFQRQLIRFARQQGLLEDLPPKPYMRRQGPEEEQGLVRSLNRAKYGHWGEALDELKRSAPPSRPSLTRAEQRRSVAEPTLGSGLGSALAYRYERFMSRDKV